MPGKTRPRNDLLCVERDVKLYSLTHSLINITPVEYRMYFHCVSLPLVLHFYVDDVFSILCVSAASISHLNCIGCIFYSLCVSAINITLIIKVISFRSIINIYISIFCVTIINIILVVYRMYFQRVRGINITLVCQYL